MRIETSSLTLENGESEFVQGRQENILPNSYFASQGVPNNIIKKI
jgi:hypothetical protein